VEYKEKCWAEQPWVGGCVTFATPGAITAYKLVHTEPIANMRVFFAGTENAYRMMGYMDGAVVAGQRAARNVLVQLQLLPPEEFNTVHTPAPYRKCHLFHLNWISFPNIPHLSDRYWEDS